MVEASQNVHALNLITPAIENKLCATLEKILDRQIANGIKRHYITQHVLHV